MSSIDWVESWAIWVISFLFICHRDSSKVKWLMTKDTDKETIARFSSQNDNGFFKRMGSIALRPQSAQSRRWLFIDTHSSSPFFQGIFFCIQAEQSAPPRQLDKHLGDFLCTDRRALQCELFEAPSATRTWLSRVSRLRYWLSPKKFWYARLFRIHQTP